jgi:hypothetical protein
VGDWGKNNHNYRAERLCCSPPRPPGFWWWWWWGWGCCLRLEECGDEELWTLRKMGNARVRGKERVTARSKVKSPEGQGPNECSSKDGSECPQGLDAGEVSVSNIV